VALDVEGYCKYRQPSITTWDGIEAVDGYDTFRCCKLAPWNSGNKLKPALFLNLSKNSALHTSFYFHCGSIRWSEPPVGIVGSNYYTRKSPDGWFFASGFNRMGWLPPYAVGSAYPGDSSGQGSAIIGLRPNKTYCWSYAVPQLFTPSAGNGFNFTSSGLGFQPGNLGVIADNPTGNNAARAYWSAMTSDSKVDNLSYQGWAMVDQVVNASPVINYVFTGNYLGAGQDDMVLCFGGACQSGNPMSFITQPQWLKYLHGMMFGRRKFDAADVAKLWFPISTTSWDYQKMWQLPERFVGFADRMTHGQLTKLIDKTAEGTIDPQTDTETAVWEAVR
jgi:hypothetical protein